MEESEQLFGSPQPQSPMSSSSLQVAIELEEWCDEDPLIGDDDLVEMPDDSNAEVLENEKDKVDAEESQDASMKSSSIRPEEEAMMPFANEANENSSFTSAFSERGLVRADGNLPYFQRGLLPNGMDYSLPPKDFYFGLNASGTFTRVQCAYLILRESRRAMSGQEIYEIAVSRKWYYSKALDPVQSFIASIRSVLHEGSPPLFVALKAKSALFGVQELMPYVLFPSSSELISSAPLLPPLNPIFVKQDRSSNSLIQAALDAPNNQKLGKFILSSTSSRSHYRMLRQAGIAAAAKRRLTQVAASSSSSSTKLTKLAAPLPSSTSEMAEPVLARSERRLRKILEEAEQIHWKIPPAPKLKPAPSPAKQKPAKTRKPSSQQFTNDISEDIYRRRSVFERSEAPLAKKPKLSSTFASPAPSLASSSSSSRSSSISVSQFEVPHGPISTKYISQLEQDISNAMQAAKKASEELQRVRELDDSSFSIPMDFSGADDSSNDTKEFGGSLYDQALDSIEQELTNRQLFEALEGFKQKRSSQSVANAGQAVSENSPPTYIVPQFVTGMIVGDGFNVPAIIIPPMYSYTII